MDLPELVPLFALPLGRAGLGYMVTGAVAAAVYGEPRLTLDLDLILSLGAREVRRLAQLFPSEEFYVPPEETLLAEAARLRHGHFNLMHLGSGLRADVYVLGNDPLHVWAFERRREVQVSGQPAWIAPPRVCHPSEAAVLSRDWLTQAPARYRLDAAGQRGPDRPAAARDEGRGTRSAAGMGAGAGAPARRVAALPPIPWRPLSF